MIILSFIIALLLTTLPLLELDDDRLNNQPANTTNDLIN